MVKLLYLDYISLIIYVLIIITLIYRSDKTNKKRDIFSMLLIVALLANIYDICSVLLDNSGPGAVTLKYILHAGYLIFRNLVTPVFGAYAIAVTDTWHKLHKRNIYQYLIWIPFAAVVVFTLSSPLTHLVFYMDASDAYTRGPLFVILYFSALFYITFCVAYIIKYRSVLVSGGKFSPLFSIVPCQVVAVVIQWLYPNILCEMFCTAMCILYIMLTVEKPDGNTDQILGVLKPSAFTEMLKNASGVNKPLTIVLINMTNHSAIISYLSPENMNELYKAEISRIKNAKSELSMTPVICSLDNGMMAAVLHGNEMDNAEKFADKLNSSLSGEYTIGNYSVSAFFNIAIINFLSDVSDIDSFRLIAKEFRVAKYNGDYTKISSVINSQDYAVMSNIDRILRNAIENDLFEVYYQPIYSIADKKFRSAEALIRLNTPEYGFISPALFIPAAEDSGLIHEIGIIMLDKVCRFIASEEFREIGLEYIEINLSVAQCMDRDLAFKIFAILDKYNINPSTLNLEITETASSFHQKNLMDNIDRLHNEGLSFSLDDFGTGYSNMVRIASLPLNIVKLDRSFTWGESNPDMKIILEESVSMLKKMNMKIVVEGIETKEMLDKFTALGCDYIQGYYFSKPICENDFISFIREKNISDT